MDITTLYTQLAQLNTWPSFTLDSRQITQNTVFFALEGTRVDGHDYVQKALDNGALYAVGQKPVTNHPNYIQVHNTLNYLQDLARYRRTKLNAKIIGLTGSNGKTTTKELLQQVLQTTYKTESTYGNLNNHLGVPLTLLNFSPDIEIGIVEMGANHMGEIQLLAEIAQPNLATITNIGKAHIGEFGSFENIIKGKGELLDYTKRQQIPFIYNHQDQNLSRIVGNYFHAKAFGTDPQVQWQYIPQNNAPASIKMDNTLYSSHLIGKYNQANIALAVSFGLYLKVTPAKIAEAISQYMPTNNRSQLITTPKHNTLIADCYNANPSSLQVALENLAEMVAVAKFIIISDMNEIGQYALEEHQAILKYIDTLGIQTIVIGHEFEQALSSIKLKYPVRSFRNTADCKHFLETALNLEHTTILLKGSRSFRLEQLINLL